MQEKYPFEKNAKTGNDNTGSESSHNTIKKTDQKDSKEDQHGKGGSEKTSKEFLKNQNANQQGFGEDE